MGFLADGGAERPLVGITVLDASRMLPGAVLARMLMDLGARVIKLEDPTSGDPMRSSPPVVDGIGAGFRAFLAGAESVGLDLRTEPGAAALRRLARHADVFVESFRPGTLDGWGLGHDRLRAANPSLVVCALSSYGRAEADRIGHDLNFMADSGLLALLGVREVPGTQVADVTGGMLACSSILAALVRRARTGAGTVIDQPLARATLPFLAFAAADRRAGGHGITEGVLAGRCSAYRLYTCLDGRRIALGALEPKFWVAFVTELGLPELAGAGLDTGEEGERAAERVAEKVAEHPAAHWLDLATRAGLPLSAVRSVDDALADPYYAEALPASSAAPRLGEHTQAALARAGFSDDEIAALKP